MKRWMFALCLGVSLCSFAETEQKDGSKQSSTEKKLIGPYPTNPMLHEVIQFTPVADHHFNLKSKNNCGNGRLIQESEKSIECQMWAPGTSELQLYVCDNKNTFCRREIFSLKTQSPSGVVGWAKYYINGLSSKDKWETPFKSGVSVNSPAKNFIHNDLKKATELAKKEKKRIFVYFTQLSCPPCRLMKEMTFAADEFQQLSSKYVLLQIDIDLDLAPDQIKPLNIKGTPTIIIFDKEFRELQRTVTVQSPAQFKMWLDKIDDAPIKDLQKKDISVLSEDQKWLLSQWHSIYDLDQDDGKEPLSVVYAKALQAQDSRATVWLDLLQLNPKMPVLEQYNLLKKMDLQKVLSDDMVWRHYMFGLMQSLLAQDPKKDKELMKSTLQLFENLETSLNSLSVDPLQKSYNLATYYSILNYILEKKELSQKKSTVRQKALSLLELFPKPPGVLETSQLELMKAEFKDDGSKKKMLEQLRAQNQADYSYDFWEASEAFSKKNYPLALEQINKSLAIAKDRSWQKAFTIKIDILMAMGKKEEAAQLVAETLGQIQLPANPKMKVHSFVQTLRKKQMALQIL